MAKGAYIGVGNFVPRTLPSGYTQIEYIQSSGTQYIETAYTVQTNTRIVCDFQLTSTPSATVVLFRNASYGFGWQSSGVFRSWGGSAVDFSATATQRHVVDKGSTECTLDTTSKATTAHSAQSETLPLLAYKNGGSIAQYVSAKLYSCKIYEGDTVVRDYVPCTNSGGTVGLYDIANGVFYTNAGSGTFTAGATYGSVARKIKKGYIGIENVARKIKKAYIGIGGVARPCFGGGELVHYGKVGDLGKGRSPVGAAIAGGVLVFPGGREGSSSGSQYVDSVNASLTVSTNKYGTNSRYYDAVAGAAGNYALSAGGTTGSSRYSYQNTVYAFNASITKTNVSDALSKKSMLLAGASNSTHAMFSGGDTYESNADPSNFADAYNGSLTKTALAVLASACDDHMGASFGDWAVFAGGFDANNKALAGVTAYNTSLTKKTTTLGTARARARGTQAGNHLLIAGGFYTGVAETTVVEAFDASFTRTTAMSLSVGTSSGPTGITSLKGFAMFMSGTICEVYDQSLTRTATFDIGATHGDGGAGVLGDYLIVGGGGSYSTRIDAFVVV